MSAGYRIAATIWTLLLLLHSTSATRFRIHPDDEPESDEVHKNARVVFGNPKLFYLESAGLLSETAQAINSTKEWPINRHNAALKFIFNGSELQRMRSNLQWFVPLDERQALQVYDDPTDQELARGPQVDQQLCGLQLDYMLYLKEKHLQAIDQSSELSIFRIMHTYDSPHHGLARGNNLFLGDYSACIDTELNIMRNHLDQVNESASDAYFAQTISKNGDSLPTMGGVIWQYIGPLLGYAREISQVSISHLEDRIRVQPMRYCLLGLRWPNWPNTSHYRRNMVLRSSACLPSTCDSSSLQFHGDKIKRLAEFAMTEYHRDYYIDQMYCLPDEQSELRNPLNYASSALFVCFIAVWFALILLATIVHLMNKDKMKKVPGTSGTVKKSLWWNYLSCWSLVRSVRDFLTFKGVPSSHRGSDRSTRRRRVHMEALEGFKVLSSISVITSHACMLGLTGVWNPDYGQHLMSRSWLASISVVAPAVVDNFFVVTGVLTATFLLKASPNTLKSFWFWPKFVLFRYVRIVPLYLLVDWFLKSYFRFIGSGPMWDYGTSRTGWSAVCQHQSWWVILLPTANFMGPQHNCNEVGWYLANDIQFTVITPIFVLLYLRRPIWGYLAALSATLLVVANHIRYYYQLGMDPRSTFEWSVLTLSKVTDDATDGYVHPQYRCIAYIIGLAAGFLLHQYDVGDIRELPRWFIRSAKTLFATISYVLCITPFITTLMPVEDANYDLRLVAAIFDGSVHMITSISAAMFVILLCTGNLPTITRIFSWSIHKPLANASLSTLLIHLPLLHYHTQQFRSLPELSLYYFVVSDFIWCVESFAIACLVYMIFEAPIRTFSTKLLISALNDKSSAKGGHTSDSKNLAKKME